MLTPLADVPKSNATAKVTILARIAKPVIHNALYPDVYKNPTTERLKSLEREVLSLKSRLKTVQSQTSAPTPSSCRESWDPTAIGISTGSVGSPLAMLDNASDP